MQHVIRNDPQLGRLLWMTDGKTEAAFTLDLGPRVIHLSHVGMENLFYRQPQDLSDGVCTDGGWRLIGGHRFWLAPEGDESYWPESEPVDYVIEENGASVTQKPDGFLHVQKSLRLTYMEDGSLQLEQSIVNLDSEPLNCALWGVNTLAGGTGKTGFANYSSNPNNPNRLVTLWGDTSLADERLKFSRDSVSVIQTPCEDYFKIGVYNHIGSIHHENKGQTLDITVPVYPMAQCADGGCNVEIFLHRRFMELEALGPMLTVQPGESASHTETWRVGLI